MMAPDVSNFRPLAGTRVLDFSHVIAGPFATFYLAQLGADVVKVERPGAGDVMRGPTAGAGAYLALNAGKRVVRLDLKTEADLAEAHRLADRCDVFLNGYRPGSLERFGFGHARIEERNPGVIYCGISGYGQSHPEYRGRGAYDHVIQALTGMTLLAGRPDDPPIKIGFPVVDAASGIIAALAIVAALHASKITGRGQFIDVSMWGAALQLMYPFVCEVLTNGTEPVRVGNQGYSGSPAADIFACKTGWIALGANTPAQFVGLYAALNWDAGTLTADLTGVEGFARVSEPLRFKERLSATLLQKDATAWESAMNRHGVPAAAVRNMKQFVDEATGNGLLAAWKLGGAQDKVIAPGLGWQANGQPAPESAVAEVDAKSVWIAERQGS